MLKQFGYIFIITSLFIGCNKFDPEEPIPAFIKIDSVSISTTSSQGSQNSSGIKDAWVYVDEELIGVFELPIDVPVLKEGENTIKIFAGIKRNGISSDGEKYPFLNPYEINTNLIPGETIELKPVFEYSTTANIWIEDFEGPGIKFSNTTNSDVNLTLTNSTNEVFEGLQSAKGEFVSSSILFEIQTDEAAFNNFNLGSTIYMEMDYAFIGRIDSSTYYNPFIVGILSRKTGEIIDTQNPYLTLYPSSENEIVWNKIYIDLTEIIRPVTPTEDLDIYIGLKYISNSSKIIPKVLLDNIKIIYQ